jgi:hypothetical protein
MQSEAHINYSRLWQYAFIRDATDKTSQPEWRLTQVDVPVKPELDRLTGVAAFISGRTRSPSPSLWACTLASGRTLPSGSWMTTC